MKLSEISTADIPVLIRHELKVKRIRRRKERFSKYTVGKKTGNVNLFRKGTTIVFPKTIDDVQILNVQTHRYESITHPRIPLLVNGKPEWVNLTSLRRIQLANSRAQKAIIKQFPFMKQMIDCVDNLEFVTSLLGKTLTISDVRKYLVRRPRLTSDFQIVYNRQHIALFKVQS